MVRNLPILSEANEPNFRFLENRREPTLGLYLNSLKIYQTQALNLTFELICLCVEALFR